MENGNFVVNYPHVQGAFEQNRDQFDKAVYDAANTAAGADAIERAKHLASWNEALAALKNEATGPGVMATPRNAMASRLQSLIASQGARAAKAGDTDILSVIRQAQTVKVPSGLESTIPAVLEVKFDSDDWEGWLGMAWKFIFKSEVHSWVRPTKEVQSIDDNATIAVFADCGTGMQGAPVVAKSIAALARCDVALHLGDTYYSPAKSCVVALPDKWSPGTSKVRNGVNQDLGSSEPVYIPISAWEPEAAKQLTKRSKLRKRIEPRINLQEN
jgi:hypothetical protein